MEVFNQTWHSKLRTLSLTGWSGFKSAQATFAPVAAKASAMLRPFPEELPVMRAMTPSLGPGAGV